MRRVTFRPAARRDLIDIHTYIAADDESAADRFIDRLRSSAEGLAEFPLRYPLVEEYGVGLRKMSVAGYALFYRVTQRGVSIYRVLHHRRDWGAIDF